MNVISNSRFLDHLAAAVNYQPPRHPGLNAYARAEFYFRERMSQEEQTQFDFFLVRMKDPLGYQPGKPIDRFAERVSRMEHLARTGEIKPNPRRKNLPARRVKLSDSRVAALMRLAIQRMKPGALRDHLSAQGNPRRKGLVQVQVTAGKLVHYVLDWASTPDAIKLRLTRSVSHAGVFPRAAAARLIRYLRQRQGHLKARACDPYGRSTV